MNIDEITNSNSKDRAERNQDILRGIKYPEEKSLEEQKKEEILNRLRSIDPDQ